MFAFAGGRELLSPDGPGRRWTRRAVVRALRFMTDVYDDLGGVEQADAFSADLPGRPARPLPQGPSGDEDRRQLVPGEIADWKPDMNFSVSPGPDARRTELAEGDAPITWAGGWALVVPAHRAAQEGRFRAHPVPSSLGGRRQARREPPRAQAQRRAAVPAAIDANRVFTERTVSRETFADDRRFPKHIQDGLSALGSMLDDTLDSARFADRAAALGPAHPRLRRRRQPQYRDEAARTGETRFESRSRACKSRRSTSSTSSSRPEPPHVVGWTPYFGIYCRGRSSRFSAPIVMFAQAPPFAWLPHARGGRRDVFRQPLVLGLRGLTRWADPLQHRFELYPLRRSDRRALRRPRQLQRGRCDDPVFDKSLLNTGVHAAPHPAGHGGWVSRIALLLNSGVRGIGVYRTGLYLPVDHADRGDRACSGCGCSIRRRAS